MRIVVILTVVAQVVFAPGRSKKKNRPKCGIFSATGGRVDVVAHKDGMGLSLTSPDGNCKVVLKERETYGAPVLNLDNPLPNWFLEFTSCLDPAPVKSESSISPELKEDGDTFVLTCQGDSKWAMTYTFPKTSEFKRDSWSILRGMFDKDSEHPDWPHPHVRKELCMALMNRKTAILIHPK